MQLEALASEVKRDWKQEEQYTAKDLITLGRILCGMDAASVGRINDVEYARASVMIGSLTRCPYSVLTKLAAKAVAQFGDPSAWSSDVVSQPTTPPSLACGADEVIQSPPIIILFISPNIVAI